VNDLHEKTPAITELILAAGAKARQEVSIEPEPDLTKPIKWPVECTVGPGLEGAIACETQVGYVNGTKGWLIYRGYDIFDLCAHSTYEEVAFLLLEGHLPRESELATFKRRLSDSWKMPQTQRLMMGFPIERMNAMSALRLGTNLMRQEFTYLDLEAARPDVDSAISADEDSIPMETLPRGQARAIYEFPGRRGRRPRPRRISSVLKGAAEMDSCCRLIAGLASLAGAIARVRAGHLPIEADPSLGHAANVIYTMTGRRPTPKEERVMDVALILHADHGMNASTFAAMVVASTLADMYFAVGSGIAALTGPLHGGANEQVVRTLRDIGPAEEVPAWFAKARAEKRKIMGFGHRVYKAYDPRARVLGPLVGHLTRANEEARPMYRAARALERRVIATLGREKRIFPNVDFYSGMVYMCLGIPAEMFTPIFAVSRVAGWTARVLEYLNRNRIFRPRAMYVGPFDKNYVPITQREGRG